MSSSAAFPSTRTYLNRTVIGFTLTSFLSDISHEMGTAVLPLFLQTLRGGAAALGLIEGVAEMAVALGKLYGGALGDRLPRKKGATGLGYLLTTLGIGSYVLATHWSHILIGRSIAWLGRGFRGPLRDAIMAGAAEPQDYGKAFGLERAGDYAGACVAPLLSAALLWMGMAFKTLLAMAMIPGLMATLCVWLLVHEKPQPIASSRRRLIARFQELPRPFRRLLVAIGFFSLGDFSNTLLILWAAGSSWTQGLHQKNIAPILLYAGYNAISTICTYVSGALSDLYGRRRLLIGAYVAAVVAALLVATGLSSLIVMSVVFALNGVAMGNKEAVEKAYAADFLAPQERSLGFGALSLITGLGKLFASTLVGTLWSLWNLKIAFLMAAAISTIGVVLLVALTEAPAPAAEASPKPS